MHKLRPYQLDCKAAIREKLREAQSTIFVMATGTGKTHTFSSIIEDFIAEQKQKRVMVIAHREELVYQAARSIDARGVSCAVEMAGEWARSSANCVVASVQTLGSRGGRLQRFNPEEFSLLVTDEAHHATADSWRAVVDHFKSNKALKVVGCTATPDRADEEALGQVFETVAFEYELSNAIADGYLVPINCRQVFVENIDFSQVRTTAGDLNGGDLEAIMTQERNIHGVVDPLFKLAGNRQCLVFAVSVAHALKICEILNRHRKDCADFVSGETPSEIRSRMLDRYQRREFQFLCNCMIATEGWDCPCVEVVAMARPTKSRALYTQMIGRGTRPLPGLVDALDAPDARRAAIEASAKPFVEVIDFVGVTGRHALISTVDILAGKTRSEVIAAVKEMAKNGERMAPEDAIKKVERDLAERAKSAEEARKLAIVKGTATFTSFVNRPFATLGIQPSRERGWDKPITPEQVEILKANKFDTNGLTEDAAKQMLAEIARRKKLRLATVRMAAILKNNGFNADMPFAQAKQIMDILAANKWRWPIGTPIPGDRAEIVRQSVEPQTENFVAQEAPMSALEMFDWKG